MSSTDIDMVSQSIEGSAFTFTGADIDDLGDLAEEFTLVTMVCDRSGSVHSYKDELEKCKRSIVQSCAKSPQPDNLMIRDISFGSNVTELHGFKHLSQINPDDYIGSIIISGATALHDASYDAIQATSQYGRDLRAKDMEANAVVIILTDGCENCSTQTTTTIKESLANIVRDETLESLNVILVGVGVDNFTSKMLQEVKDQCGYQQYVDIGDATPENLAKLAQFVSKSISAQSQSLNTGGPSQALQF